MVCLLQEVFRSLCRTGMVNFISIISMGAPLFGLELFGLIATKGLVLKQALINRVEVEIYLEEGLSRKKVLGFVQELEEIHGVAEAKYIDKNIAAIEFHNIYGEGLLDALSRNPLSTSIRVKFDGRGDLTEKARNVAAFVRGWEEVESVDVGAYWLASMDRFLQLVSRFGVLLGGLLCLSCAFAVGNTIKLMVFTQRDVIELMHLVGATGGFIRLTFLVEGALLGCFGGLLAGIVLFLGFEWWKFFLGELAPMSTIYLGLSLIGVGSILGLLGSWTSICRVMNLAAWR